MQQTLVEVFEEDCFRRRERGFEGFFGAAAASSSTGPFLLLWVNLSSVGKTTTLGRNFGRKGREGKGRFGWKGFDKPSNFDKLFHRFKSPHSCSLGFVESLPSFHGYSELKWLLSTYRRRKNPLLRLQIAVLADNKDVLMCLLIAHFEAAHGSRFLRRE